ncbi:DUF262 domain-containing protein [Pectinatus frisingensis]|uniref:DUF262 domain-containing protein n=1 Tax=Pectinatus frisingensis TaxID=865 RepID=UPI0018C79DBF|nr:DUF262 domain-containing protein [Pectinatus frisingensis]
MDINTQINNNRKKFRVDHFDIVISEYINRYKAGTLILDPPYQRTFRWGAATQSALIESILIGIPLPPIFVFSNKNYEWEIIDGLQRTTTLINFLTNKPNKCTFDSCTILTELNGKTLKELPSSIFNSINNARLRIEIVEDNGDAYSQYLLFSRLNNNGEALSNQELRNFLIYKLNSNFYTTVTNDLRSLVSYVRVMNLPKERKDKQEDVEYIIRFFISRKIMLSSVDRKKYKDINSILTEEIQSYLKTTKDNKLKEEYRTFIDTFNYLDNIQNGFGYKTFKKNLNSLPNASVIAPALSTCLNAYKCIDTTIVKDKIGKFYSEENYKKITAQSYSPVKRFFELSKYAYEYFNKK